MMIMLTSKRPIAKNKINKTMRMKKLKLMMMMTKNLTLMGNLMMRTIREWCLYRKMYYAVCNTRPAFQLAGRC